MTLFKCLPPVQSNTEFLRQAVTWQQQVQMHGGLDTSSHKVLKRGAVSAPLNPGTILIRNWQNAIYQVTVTDNGFDYNGKTYRSLSAIAKEITGTNWNGQVFFGVKS